MRANKSLEESLAIEFATVWRVLKAADTELEAYKSAVAALLIQYPKIQEFLDERLVSARQDSVLLENIRQKYELILGTCVQKLPDDLPPKVREQIESLENPD
jgi:hypothetical protein